jgi:pilus assembly protein CpaC
VEIQNGQSFIVSGLLDHRTTEIMSKVPGISSVPILGELFRSKNFNHSVVELVIIVTATVVDPLTTLPLTEPDQPKMAVPNLDTNSFDGGARDKPEAGSSAAAPQTQSPAQTEPEAKRPAQSQPQQPAPQTRTDQP